jgi:universal stress protein A
MFRRILIPTDFSTAAEWVFDDAVRIAAATGADVIILHVRRTWSDSPGELRFPADPSLYEYAEQQELSRLRERVRRSNATVQIRLVVKTAPDAGEEICRTAAEEKADLIVIATHARHHVAHLLIGSTTRSVIANPPAPALAIRYGVRKRQQLKRLIVPVHPQQTSQGAFELADQLAARNSGEVHLVTLCDDVQRGKAEELLARMAASASAPVRTEIIRGTDVEKELVRYVQKVDGDAIFLNSAGALSEVKLDIIRRAPRAVMIVPAGTAQA